MEFMIRFDKLRGKWIATNQKNNKFIAYSDNYRIFGTYSWTIYNDSQVNKNKFI